MAQLIGEIEMYRGDSYPLDLTIKNKETSEAIDLTDYSFLLTVDTLSEPENDETKVFGIIGAIASDQGVDTGKVVFKPTTENTDIIPETYFYDIQMTDAAGNIRTIVKDKWKIKQDITK